MQKNVCRKLVLKSYILKRNYTLNLLVYFFWFIVVLLCATRCKTNSIANLKPYVKISYQQVRATSKVCNKVATGNKLVVRFVDWQIGLQLIEVVELELKESK